MEKVVFFILICFSVAHLAFAQIPLDEGNAKFTQDLVEKVRFYTDRDLYLAGEEVWFSAFDLENHAFVESGLSSLIYLEVFDATQRKIFKGKFEVKQGLVSGSFKIPTETLSGNYFIRAYTQYQRNFSPGSFSTHLIRIINPGIPLPAQNPKEDSASIANPKLKPNDPEFEKAIKIGIKANKTVYKKRDAVLLDVQLGSIQPEDIAGLCVSIIRHGTCEPTDEVMTMAGKPSTGMTNLNFWLSETRGVGISGTLTDKKTSQPLNDVNVYLSVLGNQPQLHITKTKANGAFLFSLGFLTREHEIFIGTEPDKDHPVQLLVNNNFSNDFASCSEIPFSVDTSYKDLLEEMWINLQSKSLFNHETAEIDNQDKSTSLFGTPDVSVRLDDYIDLPNLENVIYELIPTVAIKKKAGITTLTVMDPVTEYISENQLLLLDHVPVFDLDAVLNIPPVKIKSIHAINKSWYLGDNSLENVVMINSKAGGFAGYIFPEESIFLEYQTLIPEKKFESPTYLGPAEKNSHIPDFRTLLYWNPHLNLSTDDASIKFYTSDNTGVYDIILRGITKDGQTCFGQGKLRIE